MTPYLSLENYIVSTVNYPAIAALLRGLSVGMDGRYQWRNETFCCKLQVYWKARHVKGKHKRGFIDGNQICLDDDFVSKVKIYANAASRSVPKQLEYWAKIGSIAEDNPDLPYSFISEILLAHHEARHQKIVRYVRKTARKGS